MKKKRAGRIWITFEVTEKLKKAVEAAAEQDGRSVSEFVRFNLGKILEPK